MPATLLDDGVTTLLSEVLTGEPATVFVVHPDGPTVREIIDLLGEAALDVRIRVLVEADVIKPVMDDFVTASTAADLIDEGVLAVRTSNELSLNALLIAEGIAIALVRTDGHVNGLSTTDEVFVSDLLDRYGTCWTDADPYQLRTPPLSEVKHTLARDISEHAEADFSGILTALESLDDNGRRLDEVTISLLVAARNEELLYDISKWGEDVGIASKATFSRTKTELETAGLLATEKVPIDVGRPRLRLKLDDDALAEASIEKFAQLALDRLP